MKVKLDELAKLAGVSRTTASYVVNGKAKHYRVSDKTIEKVEELIKKYDFKPNAMAAGLRAGKSHTIGLIVPDFENASYAKIASRLEAGFREKGYQLLIACSNDNADNEIKCAKHLFQRQIDALIVSTALPSDTDFYQRFADVPVVGFDRRLMMNEMMLLTDDEGDAYRLAQRLIKDHAGKRVLFLSALPEFSVSYKRELGFRNALNGQCTPVDYLYANQFHKLSSAEVFSQWLDKNALPEAIFVTSLTLLQGIFQVLIKRYNSIPKELVIATFGHHEMLDVLENKVICCVQNHEKIAQSLLNLVLHKMREKNIKQPHEVIVRELIESRT
ncbi:catabolite repressor/activator [Pasteurella oralis]|uniref:catabolite repressor/activator n=1 Tax=Pasteurella oralis TaxID=1071947 RepID=UPI000C7AF558|nr:catabolite repressor/activator [Pasteurella oralis]